MFQTLEDQRTITVSALLDSGATDSFIDLGMAVKHNLDVTIIKNPIPVFNADGGRNKSGDIKGYVDLEMRLDNHKKIMRLYVTLLGRDQMFIGHDWLRSTTRS